MDKAEHAARLRAAMAERGYGRERIADYVGTTTRSVTNWTSEKKPVMPGPEVRARLRELLGDYDKDGDPVEVALSRSSLVTWRRERVRSEYHRHLYEQAREEAV